MAKKKKVGRPSKISTKRTPTQEHWKTRQKRENQELSKTPESSLYQVYTPVEGSGSRVYQASMERARKIDEIIKTLPEGKAFNIEKSASAWARQYFDRAHPDKKFVVSILKDSNLARVTLRSRKVPMAPEEDRRHKHQERR